MNKFIPFFFYNTLFLFFFVRDLTVTSFRYCFLAFGWDERVIANRDNCRLLLVRLKMDGWALGRTKVFLKYYHVEFLSKQYEEQLRKIVMVQACIRRWLAKIHFKREKWQLAVSVVTLQRHIRGWLSRKHTIEDMKNKLQENQSKSLQKATGIYLMFDCIPVRSIKI